MTEVYVVHRKIAEMDHIARIFRRREDAQEYALDHISEVSNGNYRTYTVDNIDVVAWEDGNWRCAVVPFEVQ